MSVTIGLTVGLGGEIGGCASNFELKKTGKDIQFVKWNDAKVRI
jgi:hypothetical protein